MLVVRITRDQTTTAINQMNPDRLRQFCTLQLAALALFAAVNLWADPGGAAASASAASFFDDGAFRKLQSSRAIALDAKGKLVRGVELRKQLQRENSKLALPDEAPAETALSLKQIHQKCSGSVFSIAEVRDCDGCGKVHVTPFGTGFAITADGALFTNRHLIEEMVPSSRLVASIADGTTYPVVEVLASSQKDDAAVIRIDGSGFRPLRLSTDNHVGTRVAVISHPTGSPYTLSEGIVTRLATQLSTRFMLISAEFALGSSGAPVLDSSGDVLGMATFTKSVNDQMVLRGCIPTQSLLELVTDSKPEPSKDTLHDPLATERDCLKATFAAMQKLGQQSGEMPAEEFNEKLAALHSAMMNAIEKCPDDPVAKRYTEFLERQRKGRAPGSEK